MKNPKDRLYSKQIILTSFIILLAFCISKSLSAKEKNGYFFTKDKRRIFYVDIDGIGKKNLLRILG